MGSEMCIRDSPTTLIKDIPIKLLEVLGDNGIVTLKQILEIGSNGLVKKCGIKKKSAKSLVEKAKKVIRSN